MYCEGPIAGLSLFLYLLNLYMRMTCYAGVPQGPSSVSSSIASKFETADGCRGRSLSDGVKTVEGHLPEVSHVQCGDIWSW